MPYRSCGLTSGSCTDINTYLVASLRAAWFEAGYAYGYFFPQDSGGVTHDMHCWVVTHFGGHVLEWDI
ncbi:transglutaminase domain-containing protein [Thalassococcus sp. BH17M4-6]|uniref:transglutaminase domain-containing protein n=1 Tax=Thalassococcus sp. BH17M4-6 TaxID=3413148 RepID=UPI003BCCC36D